MLALIGLVLIIAGAGSILAAVAGAIVAFGGLSPDAIGQLGYATIYGYPLAGDGALLLIIVGLALAAAGGALQQQ